MLSRICGRYFLACQNYLDTILNLIRVVQQCFSFLSFSILFCFFSIINLSFSRRHHYAHLIYFRNALHEIEFHERVNPICQHILTNIGLLVIFITAISRNLAHRSILFPTRVPSALSYFANKFYIYIKKFVLRVEIAVCTVLRNRVSERRK
ncbi:hypothetical protein PUN28_016262 [Cardiocondyla obscurior]|uniref:Uncharacterized protein n=1 Tax=Cardiocondyla obscurior TaxID=286306 RepID=A0AAW2ESU8_9HYME